MMLHRTLNVLTALAVLGVLLLIVALLWVKRWVCKPFISAGPRPQRQQFWPVIGPQTAG